MLKNFKINTERDLLAPDLQCYQMGLRGLIDNLATQGKLDEDEDFKYLPSWLKYVSNPERNKNFYTRMLQAIFEQGWDHDELSVDIQFQKTDPNASKNPRVAVMFLPDGTLNKNISTIKRQSIDALPTIEIIVLSGSETYRGTRITNRNAEKIVKDVLRSGRSVLIITSKLAQRSFSIPELSEVYLAYDGGDIGATTQKASRSLTPGDKNKVAKVISLSFDPNRDDKFDAMILETAENINKRHGLNDMKEAMRIVLRTMDIFSCQPEGALKIQVDDYLKHAMERKGFSRVIGSKLDMSRLDKDTIAAMASGNRNYMRAAVVQATPMGKSHETIIIDPGTPAPRVPQNQMDKKDLRDLTKAREVALTILENLDIIVHGTGQKNIHDAMATVEADSEMRGAVEEEFGVPFEIVQMLLSTGVINQSHVDIVHNI